MRIDVLGARPAHCAAGQRGVQKGGTPPPSSSAYGTKTIAKPDGSTWKCTFGDDFGARTLDGKKWIAQETANSGFHSGPECCVNTSKNVSLSGGYLNLTVRKEATPFTCSDPYGNYTTQYTSGMVHTWNPAAPLVKPAPFDQPFMVALTQALGVGGNAFDPATTPLQATTQIDYVRVWS